ncbi:hypothetical protein K3G63_21840 [Hymenobacter sp. HSC-4F20]|uniref:hypothetical protein n=1 Tax=Hymenobacter sp. HSC-4F20 TaxID=2864135 RepID=UPI001C730343|nr:hypothetical protein [Hymenobacter sp. HSC-4F20]MBX0293102.1 hypothetical protein [Hymenobacter sp. HSC-4F20]
MSSLPTTPRVFFENPLAVILTEECGQYIRLVWKQAAWNLAAARTVMEQLLLCLHQTGWGKVIIKQPPLPTFPLAYHTWLLYDWFPRAEAAGGWCYALIPPKGLFAHVGFADFLCQLRRRGVRLCVASSREQALEWLIQQAPEA